MSYNKKTHLRTNIEAIKLTFSLDKESHRPTTEEQAILKQYSGFGGLKCVLNPTENLSDISRWAKSELELFPLVAELHQVIRDNTASEKEYKQYVNSIKNSVLTVFYTPPEIVSTLAGVLKEVGITPSRILDPSARTGEFIHALQGIAADNKEPVSFEKIY